MTIIEGPSTTEKVFFWGLGLLMVAFLISVPFMIRDQIRWKEQQWQDKGCQMYDNYSQDEVPAKCSSYFVDHYKSQQLRVQPPDAVEEK